MTELLTRAVRGGGVTVVGQAAKLVIQVASVVVLSRLLVPEDFGLVAMVAAFVAFGELFRDFGTTVVGLQRRVLSHQQSSNLFWIATALGCAAALALVALTPLIVELYDEPRLDDIVPALAIAILLNAMSAQLQVHLSRQMRYARLVVADILGVGLGFALATIAAISGWGYWALVAQTLVTAGAGLAARWIASGWHPSRPRRDTSTGGMVRDSAAFGIAQSLTYIAQNLDTVLVGARWNAASLGMYSRAFQLLTVPLSSMMGPLTQVVIPTVNRAQDEGRSPHAVLLRVQFVLGVALVWVYAVTAGIAPWLVPVALGPNWGEVVPIFRILAVGGSFWVFSQVSYWAFVVWNRGGQLLGYNIVSKGITAALILGASFVSIEAVAWAVSVGLVISWPLNLFWLARTVRYPAMTYFRSGSILLVAGGVAFAVTAMVWSASTNISPLVGALLAATAGTGTYVASICATRNGRVALKLTVRAVQALNPWRDAS